MRIAVAIGNNNGWNSIVAYRFARAPFFAIIDVENGKVVKFEIIPNQYGAGARGVGPAVANWLANLGVNIVVGPHIGPNAAMALRGLGIEFRQINAGTLLRDVIRILGFSL